MISREINSMDRVSMEASQVARCKETACQCRRLGLLGLIPGSERSSGGGNGSSLQYSCWDNLMDRKAWWAIVHRVSKSRILLSG